MGLKLQFLRQFKYQLTHVLHYFITLPHGHFIDDVMLTMLSDPYPPSWPNFKAFINSKYFDILDIKQYLE